MTTRIPAEAFPPNEFVQEELTERGWTVDTLAERSGLPRETVNRLMSDDRFPVTHEIASGLSRAFGSSAALWLNLQRSYTDWVAAHAE